MVTCDACGCVVGDKKAQVARISRRGKDVDVFLCVNRDKCQRQLDLRTRQRAELSKREESILDYEKEKALHGW